MHNFEFKNKTSNLNPFNTCLNRGDFLSRNRATVRLGNVDWGLMDPQKSHSSIGYFCFRIPRHLYNNPSTNPMSCKEERWDGKVSCLSIICHSNYFPFQDNGLSTVVYSVTTWRKSLKLKISIFEPHVKQLRIWNVANGVP